MSKFVKFLSEEVDNNFDNLIKKVSKNITTEPKIFNITPPSIDKSRFSDKVTPDIRNKLLSLGSFFLFLLIAITFYTGFLSNISNDSRKDVSAVTDKTGRSIRYSGIIKDSLGNKIDTKTDISFSLYKSSDAENPIYTGACKGEKGITPSIAGKINVYIGKDCEMKPIPTELFMEEPSIYLGITIGSDKELKPRTQIPNTSYSLNSEQLQGLSIGNSESSIPYINDRGSIILGADSPTLYSSSEETPLTIESSENLILRSGFNADLQFEAQESGNIEFRTGGFSDTLPQMYISNFGNVGVGTINPEEYKLQVAGDVGPDSDSLYDLGSESSQWSNIYATNFLQNGVPLCDMEGNNCPSDNIWISSKPYIYQNDTSQKFGIGSNSTESIESQLYVTRDIINGATGKALAIFNQTENQDIFTASASGSLRFVIKNSGNTGIGTINPSAKLDVSGGQTKIEVSTQYTQKLCHSGSDGINTQNVVLGDCDSSSADLAEYYGTDDPSLEPGDLVSPGKPGIIDDKSSKAYVIKTPAYNQNFIGVVSTNPYEVFGNNYSEKDLKVPIALSGRVPIKIAAESENILPGDPITASSVPGKAMKATNEGRIIGFALGDWNKNNPEARLITFISPSWHNPHTLIDKNGELVKRTINNDSEYIYDGITDNIKSHNETSLISKVIKELGKKVYYISSALYVEDKIISPLIETENIIASGEATLNNISTNKIAPSSGDLIIDLAKDDKFANTSSDNDKLTEVIFQGLDRMRAASIDSAGNATFSGVINTDNIVVNNDIKSKTITSDTIISDGINTDNASISGTLIADNIQSKTISQITNKIDSLESSAGGYLKSLESKNDLAMERLNSTVNELQKILADMKNSSLPESAQTTKITDENIKLTSIQKDASEILLSSNNNISAQADAEMDNLRVSNVAEIYNANVTGSLMAGSLLIENNSILSLAWDLNLSSLANISFFEGAVKFSKDGSIIADGNIIAKSGITTNEISSLDKSLTIKLANREENNSSTDVKDSKVIIANAAGETVGSINNEGVATFNGLVLDSYTDTSVTKIVSPTKNFNSNGESIYSLDTERKTAGVGIIPENESEVILYNDRVSSASLVYLTIADSVTDTQLAVVKKESCDKTDKDSSENCKPYFKVASSNATHPEIKFNWLIIN